MTFYTKPDSDAVELWDEDRDRLVAVFPPERAWITGYYVPLVRHVLISVLTKDEDTLDAVQLVLAPYIDDESDRVAIAGRVLDVIATPEPDSDGVLAEFDRNRAR